MRPEPRWSVVPRLGLVEHVHQGGRGHAGVEARAGLLLRLLAESAVFVFPSVMDTFGYAPIEAMAMGTPVVAYRSTALPETVREGVSGLLVEPDDDDALGAAIERILDDAPLRTRLGAQAQEEARSRFDARVTTAALVDVLHEAEARHR